MSKQCGMLNLRIYRFKQEYNFRMGRDFQVWKFLQPWGWRNSHTWKPAYSEILHSFLIIWVILTTVRKVTTKNPTYIYFFLRESFLSLVTGKTFPWQLMQFFLFSIFLLQMHHFHTYCHLTNFWKKNRGICANRKLLHTLGFTNKPAVMKCGFLTSIENLIFQRPACFLEWIAFDGAEAAGVHTR